MQDGGPDGAAPTPVITLAELTTLRLGGPARSYVEATSESDLVSIIAAADRRDEPVLVLGGGSNLVVGDDGFDGLVVAVRTRGVDSTGSSGGAVVVEVAAGEEWDGLVGLAVTNGWSGLECLAGIPGLVGASPIQNVGAYGQDVSAVLDRVRVWDRVTGLLRTFTREQCGFGYRTSRFKTEPGRFVVLAVCFALPIEKSSQPIGYAELARTLGVAPGARVPLAAARQAVLELRSGKGMVLDPADHDTWSAGSFFVNPVLDSAAYAAVSVRARERGIESTPPSYVVADGVVKVPAAWLIERSGFGRGYGNNRVRLSSKHTLALTNRGSATTADLLALAAEVRAGVAEAFGVELQLEPVVVGVD